MFSKKTQLSRSLGCCILCDKTIKNSESYYHCTSDDCFWHKTCLNNDLSFEQDEKIDAGYGGKRKKGINLKCQCGNSVHKHNSKKEIAKKVLRYGAAIALVVILI